MPIYRLDKEEASEEGEGDLGHADNRLLLDVSLALSSVRPHGETSEADATGEVDVAERELGPAVEDTVDLLVGHFADETSVTSPHGSKGSERLHGTLEEREQQGDGGVPLVESDVADVKLLGQLVLAFAALESLVLQESHTSSSVDGGGHGEGGGKERVTSHGGGELVEGGLLDESLDGVAESSHDLCNFQLPGRCRNSVG